MNQLSYGRFNLIEHTLLIRFIYLLELGALGNVHLIKLARLTSG